MKCDPAYPITSCAIDLEEWLDKQEIDPLAEGHLSWVTPPEVGDWRKVLLKHLQKESKANAPNQ